MTSRQILTATAILALVAGATAADAAPRRRPAPPKPVCKLIQDAPNDATETVGVAAPNDPALDIISADLASNATHITAVWRVQNLAGDQTSYPGGRAYQTSFMIHGKVVVLAAAYVQGNYSWQNGQGTGVVDAAKNEIRVTVPIASLSEKFRPNERLTELSATSWRNLAHQNFKLGRVDAASAVKPYYYQASYPSCVKVGA